MALKSVEHFMVVDNDEAIAIGIVVSTLYLALYPYPLLYMKLDR